MVKGEGFKVHIKNLRIREFFCSNTDERDETELRLIKGDC